MNLNKLTEKAQEAVLGAQKLAETLGHPQIEPEHLLIALLEQQDGVAPAVLRKMNARPGGSRARRCAARSRAAAGLRRRAARRLAAPEAGRRSRAGRGRRG